MLEHIGNKSDELRSEIRKHNTADACKLRAGVDFKLAAHVGGFARYLLGGAGRCAFLHHGSIQPRQPDLAGGFVDCAGTNEGADGYFRNDAIGHDGHFHAVGQREIVRGWQMKRLGRWALRRVLLSGRESGNQKQRRRSKR